MHLKSRTLAAVAALALTGGLAAGLTAGPASAATPSCGGNCVEIFNHDFGTHTHPAFVADTLKQAEKVGAEQILFRVSNSDPAEDFTYSYQGQVSDFYAAGLVGSTLALHYGCSGTLNGIPCSAAARDDFAFEEQYSQYGVDSGLCAGLASTAVSGEKVTLQPCGVSSKTIWVVDSADTVSHGYVPLINGSDTNFSQPFVLTYPSAAYPTDMPRPQLEVTNLTGFQGAGGLPAGTVNSSQLFGADTGVLAP